MLPPFVYKLIGIGLIFAIVGGTIYAGYRYVVNLQEQVVELNAENLRLDDINDGLERQLAQQKQIAADRQKEVEEAHLVDEQSRLKISELEIELADVTRQERKQRILDSRKASLYLKFVQNYEKCLALHFDDSTGKCNFRGEFVPNEAIK